MTAATGPGGFDDDPGSARALLERFHYGHGPEVEAILRFAREHRLEDDNLVFLLVAILKGNEELVRCILQAIAGTEQAIDNSAEAGRELRALAQQLVAQIDAAAQRSAGHLNVAADRLSATMRRVEELGLRLAETSRDLWRTQGVFDAAVEVRTGKTTLADLRRHILSEARADLRKYHAAIIEELSDQVRREVWAIHAYGLTGLFALVCCVFTLLLRSR